MAFNTTIDLTMNNKGTWKAVETFPYRFPIPDTVSDTIALKNEKKKKTLLI